MLAKVMTALRADPAAVSLQKIAAVAVPEAEDCAVSEDVAREANQAITDMLVGDKTLFSRLPKLLAEAGMDLRDEQERGRLRLQIERAVCDRQSVRDVRDADRRAVAVEAGARRRGHASARGAQGRPTTGR